ncbi:MAG: membrane protein insertase YidC [Gallionella sp.]|jgi:YidC/Oxa1 family membrane protein insertase|nr:membrane protein insertase YidC [Gallionella sp.]
MDIQRLFLFLIFSFSLVMVWDGWQRYQHPELEQPAVVTTSAPTPSPASRAEVTSVQKAKQAGRLISVKTDLFEAKINTVGGDLDRLILSEHRDALDSSKPFVLFSRGEGTHEYVAQSGLLGEGLPNHNTEYLAEQDNYVMAAETDRVQVRLTAPQIGGANVVKVLTFHRGSYLIDQAYEVENIGVEPVKVSSYFQLVRDSQPPAGSSSFIPTFTGPAIYTDKEKFQKIEFSEIAEGKAEYPKRSGDGWVGMLQHYFVAALLVPAGSDRENYTRKLDDDLYSTGVILPETIIAPGQTKTEATTLYAGPATAKLDDIAPGLGLTVDYGWLTVIANPLFWLMSLLHGWVLNWGVAIILLTFLIKLAFFPLSAASYRSMAKMRLVAPKLEKIKQQYSDDREQLNRAMMDLYKTEKINPLGGCLPVLVQIPVFIALYWAILSSVEMRHAPFFGWITDLSVADPYYILPVIMGVSMIVQMRLNPVPPDPIQAKVMKIMPIAFSVIFFFFPAGLVLYSIVNNLLSIAQQWYITRQTESGQKGAAAKR